MFIWQNFSLRESQRYRCFSMRDRNMKPGAPSLPEANDVRIVWSAFWGNAVLLSIRFSKESK